MSQVYTLNKIMSNKEKKNEPLRKAEQSILKIYFVTITLPSESSSGVMPVPEPDFMTR